MKPKAEKLRYRKVKTMLLFEDDVSVFKGQSGLTSDSSFTAEAGAMHSSADALSRYRLGLTSKFDLRYAANAYSERLPNLRLEEREGDEHRPHHHHHHNRYHQLSESAGRHHEYHHTYGNGSSAGVYDTSFEGSAGHHQGRGMVNNYHHETHQHLSRHHQALHHHRLSQTHDRDSRSLTYYESPPSAYHGAEFLHDSATNDLGHKIAQVAERVARSLGTVGNCALGPRLTFQKFGLNLPAVVATKQGEILEKSGLFYEVPASDVRPGDYGFRHWKPSIVRSHGGVDKGDAFIVSGVGPRGILYGANDHHFVVPGDGQRYRDTVFLRPTEEFLKRTAFA